MPSALAAGLLEGAAGADFGADELVVDRWEDALPEFLGFVDGADERVERVAVLEVEQHLPDAQGDVCLAGTAGQVGEALNPSSWSPRSRALAMTSQYPGIST